MVAYERRAVEQRRGEKRGDKERERERNAVAFLFFSDSIEGRHCGLLGLVDIGKRSAITVFPLLFSSLLFSFVFPLVVRYQSVCVWWSILPLS